METKINKSVRRIPREATTPVTLEEFERRKLEIARKQLEGKDLRFLLEKK